MQGHRVLSTCVSPFAMCAFDGHLFIADIDDDGPRLLRVESGVDTRTAGMSHLYIHLDRSLWTMVHLYL
jgi:hypothetical protein